MTDCLKGVETHADHAKQLGLALALDGYPIHAELNSEGLAATNLDSRGGNSSDSSDYHYHAGAPGSNQVLGCHTGETGCVLSSTGQSCYARQSSSRGGPPQNGGGSQAAGLLDLSEAASKLGVSEDALGQAIRSAGGPPPDFEKIASTLGVSVSDLKAAMPSRR